MRLVHHDDPLVLVQDGELAWHDRLLAQVTVEPHEGVRAVGLVSGPGVTIVVHESLCGQHRFDIDLVRELVP